MVSGAGRCEGMKGFVLAVKSSAVNEDYITTRHELKVAIFTG